ncbi:uncharacterized protein LOC112163991 [Rosa chinensis]|uniref:uncharacterized protein LOC112163991 n=1 Tax=Rosa chinensis TaxID=74649 RepID=UPI000D0937D7|nr:uncharacterized protein LOC112163991 [Rosa chinensis]
MASRVDKGNVTENSKQSKSRPIWKPAARGQWKLKVDGSFVPQIPHGGVGGILRDDTGKFKAAFIFPIQSVASAKQVELCAIKEGLEILKALQISNVVIETDCLEAVSDIADRHFTHINAEGLIDDIRSNLALLSNV